MNEQEKKLSYTSVQGKFPLKIIMNKELLNNIIIHKAIIPFHPRLNITNRCNLACDWCSRAETNRKLELSYEKIVEVMEKYKEFGCGAVTISGGGEPLMHERISDVIRAISDMGIKIGIITNGWFLNKLDKCDLDRITWIRVSSGDGRTEGDTYWKNLKETVELGNTVDWAFSYVLTENPDFELIKKVVTFSNENEFTHVRVINDLSISDNSHNEHALKIWFTENKVNADLVTYQTQSQNKGSQNCLIGLLRPVIDTDGNIYPCCNTQFAINSSKKNWIKYMSLGTVNDIEKMFSEQKCFDGRKCIKCYSHHYNVLLTMLLSDINHKEFV